MSEIQLIEKPFDWNDNLSEVALEDFSMIQKSLPYGTCQTIGMALAKLELLEKQGAEVKERDCNNCANAEADTRCYRCCKGLENNYVPKINILS